MKNLWTLIILITLPVFAFGQLYYEPFSSSGVVNGSTTTISCSGVEGDTRTYLGVFNDTEIDPTFYGGSATEYYFAGQDIGDANAGACSTSETLTITGLDISGVTGDLILCFDIAEDDDGSNQDWEVSDLIEITAAMGGFPSQPIVNISGTDSNTEPVVDTDCDGADTTEDPAVTSSWTTYCFEFPILFSATTLDIEFGINGFAAFDEDFAIDNIYVWDSDDAGAPASTTLACFVCTDTPTASSGTGTISLSGPAADDPLNGGVADVNTLDDGFIADLAAASGCAGTFIPTIGTIGVTGGGTGAGTISGLLLPDGTSVANVPFQLYEVSQSCSDDAVIGDILLADGANGSTLQDAAPTPSDLTSSNIFSEVVGSGDFSGRNQVCMDFTGLGVQDVGFWIGDVETSDAVPGLVFVYDESGNLISSEQLPTVTSSADQISSGDGLCEGSSAADNGGDCGNDETLHVSVSADVNIGQICIQVGDFYDDITTAGGSEHLSFGGVVTGGSCLVPVTLTDFRVEAREDQAALSWSTASEIDNAFFIVEHSIDSRNFEGIGQIEGAGNTIEEQQYNFVHETPANGTNYYRLKQVDFDGSFEYSEIQSVKFGKDSWAEVVPTLAKDEVLVRYDNELSSDGLIQIYSLTGELVLQTSVETNALEQGIDISHFDAGHYFLRITSSNKTLTKRFVKQ